MQKQHFRKKATDHKSLTPLLHKDASESNGCSHKKAFSNLFGMLSKSHSWINPGDDIDFTATPLWLWV
jgi:hypothetical protein